MAKKSVKRRIQKKKQVVKKRILNKIDSKRIERTAPMSARDGMMMNRMAGIVPQNLGNNSPLLQQQQKNETLDKLQMDMSKHMSSLREEHEKKMKKYKDSKIEMSNLKDELKKSEAEKKQAVDNAIKVESMLKQIDDNKRAIETGTANQEIIDVEAKKSRIEAEKINLEHELKIQKKEIEYNRQYAAYKKLSAEVDVMKNELAASKSIVDSQEFKNTNAALQKLLGEKMQTEHRLKAMKEQLKLDEEIAEKKMKINIMNDPRVTGADEKLTADIQNQMTAKHTKIIELENVLFDSELKKAAMDKRKVEVKRYTRQAVEMENRASLLSAQNAALSGDTSGIKKSEKAVITKLGQKSRLAESSERKLKQRREIIELNRKNAIVEAKSAFDKLVNAETYGGNDPDVLKARQEKDEEKARLKSIGESQAIEESRKKFKKIQDMDEKASDNITILSGKIAYGNTPQAIANLEAMDRMAENIGAKQAQADDMLNIIEGTKVVNRIHREEKIKKGEFMGRATADDQFQIANESLKEVYTHLQTKNEIERKITALINTNQFYFNGFLAENDWDYQNYTSYIENSSPNELKELYDKMVKYFRQI